MNTLKTISLSILCIILLATPMRTYGGKEHFVILGIAALVFAGIGSGIEHIVDAVTAPGRVKETLKTTQIIAQNTQTIIAEQQQQAKRVEQVSQKTTQNQDLLTQLLQKAEEANTRAGTILNATSSIKEDTTAIAEDTKKIPELSQKLDELLSRLPPQQTTEPIKS